MIPLLRVFLLLLAAICASVASAQTPPGDVTGNGYISSRDVWMARDYIAGYAPLEDEEKNRADMNTDGGVDVADLLGIVNANEATTPMLFISQPQPGDRWPRGTTQGITWESAGSVAEPLIVTLLSSGTTFLTLSTATSDTGVFLWEIPSDLAPGDAYAIRIESPTPGIVDETSTFSILGDITIPPPTTKLVDGWLVLPTETPLEPTSLTLYAAGGGAPIMGDWSFTGLEMWNQGEGQFVFLETNDGAEVMMGYVEPDVVTSGILALTPGHHAEAAIAFSPVMFALTDEERREVLDIARVHVDFPTLVLMIIQVLKTDPLSLPDYGTNPHIYDLAATIASDAHAAWLAAPAPVVMVNEAPENIGPNAVVRHGIQHRPHVEFDSDLRNLVTAVNPQEPCLSMQWGYIWYYYRQWRITYYDQSIMGGGGGTYETSVRKEVRINDGHTHLYFQTGKKLQNRTESHLRDPGRANVMKGALIGLNTLAPSGTRYDTNEVAVEAALDRSSHLDAVTQLWVNAGLDYENNWFQLFLRSLNEVLLAGGNYSGSGLESILSITDDMTSAQGRALFRYLRSANRWLQNSALTPASYESLNSALGFFALWAAHRPSVGYCIQMNRGVATATHWWINGPTVRVSMSDPTPTVGQLIKFDASETTDDEETTETIKFRYQAYPSGWDSGAPEAGLVTALVTHTTTGAHWLRVNAYDNLGRWDERYLYYYVFEEPTATVEIDVTPDEGSWSLLGPASFTTVRGSGDRLGGSAFTGAPPGAYTLVCNDNVKRYEPPELETKKAKDNQIIRFDATWIEEEFNTITIMLPGDIPMHLGRVPLGPFEMSSPLTERGRDGDENTTHTVTFDDDYFIGITEVTQAQWTAIMIANFARGSGRGPDYPIYNVTWDSIVASDVNFLQRLNRYLINTGQLVGTIRLPSEAEWEKACRADTTTRFYFGDSLGCNDYDTDCAAGVLPGNRSDYLWFGFNDDNPARGTKEVGQKGANALNLYDMHGNVWEWCQDYYHPTYAGAPTDGSAWVSPASSYRVLRGGAWDRYIEDCRSANRLRTYPNSFLSGTGFRVALDGSAD